jgi:hypothetical protein
MARQHDLYRLGTTETLQSKHLTGRAIDVMAIGDLNADGVTDAKDRARTWDPEIYCTIANVMFRAAKELQIDIRWGGDFHDFFDGPHFELA